MCPRSLALRVHRVLLFLSRNQRKQLVEVPTVLTPTRIAVQIAEQIVGIQFLRVVVASGVLKVLSQNRVQQQRHLLERISERTVEQIVDIPSSGGGLGHGFSSSAGPAEKDFTGFFSHVSHGKKCGVPRHVSSWTPAAHGQPRGSDEEEKDELLAVPTQLRTRAQWGAASGAHRRLLSGEEEEEEEEEVEETSSWFLIFTLL